MEQSRRLRLEQVYAAHPVAAATVLDRVLRDRRSLQGLTESDLADGPAGSITDQNHVGGAQMTRSLAAALGLHAGDVVLDVGAGIGGTVRLFAAEFGCRCHGVELTHARFRDAVELTRMVGLSDLVSFTQADFLDLPATQSYDVVIAQGAAMHFGDVLGFVRRVSAHLKVGGRFAIEDAVLAEHDGFIASEYAELISRLEKYWNGTFQTRDSWTHALSEGGFGVDHVSDFSAAATEEFRQVLKQVSRPGAPKMTKEEAAGTELGARLFESGVLRQVRVMARKEKDVSR